MKYRIIEDSEGHFRVQFRKWFIWFWLRDFINTRWLEPECFTTKELALEEIEKQKKLDNYKVKVKIHKMGD